jgi:hypothetical protein
VRVLRHQGHDLLGPAVTHVPSNMRSRALSGSLFVLGISVATELISAVLEDRDDGDDYYAFEAAAEWVSDVA